ncbi:unnamed protein product, partial [Brassica oleracea var. botrytis]
WSQTVIHPYPCYMVDYLRNLDVENDLLEGTWDKTWRNIYICLQSSKQSIKSKCVWWIYSKRD